MKVKFLFVIMVVILLGASCARVIEMVERPLPPDMALFVSAQEAFEAADYDKALALYTAYLETYPEGEKAPSAMLKIGLIRIETEQYAKARGVFEQVMETFPETDFALQAEVETLYSYFREGRHAVVIENAAALEKKRFPPVMRMRINRIAGDSYMEKAAYQDALERFLEAFAQAPREYREDAGARLMKGASYLDQAALETVIEGLDGNPPAGYLLYQKGQNLVDAGRIGEAIATFSDFTERFPRHGLWKNAREKVAQLESMAYFEGHRIGVLLPLSGQYATFGQKALRGIELALSEYSRRVALDPPIEIIVEDTAADADKTVRAVRRLGEKKVAAIVGPIVMADVAAKEARNMEIPIITLTQKADIVDIGDYVFRNFLTARMQVDALVAYATGTLGLERFAILYPDEAYGETFLHLFWDKLIENNGVVVGVEKYNPEKTDFSVPIKKLVGLYHDVPDHLQRTVFPLNKQLFQVDTELYDGNVPGLVRVLEESTKEGEDPWEEEDKAIVDFDAVFIPDSPGVAGLIIPQLRYYDISDAYLLGTNLWHSQRLIDIAGRQLRQMVIPEGFFSQSRRPGVRRFVSRFQAIYGEAPGLFEASGYDSAMILFDVIARPDVDNRVAVNHALLNMDPFEGLTGKTVFDETGEAVKALYLLEISRGRFSEIRN